MKPNLDSTVAPATAAFCAPRLRAKRNTAYKSNGLYTPTIT
jgi:hypothetical protein